MTFVLDASVAASWLLPAEFHPETEAVLERMAEEDALAPRLFWYEIRNLLLMNERKQRITPQQTTVCLLKIQALPLYIDEKNHDEDALALARRHALSLYDAVYLELALRHACPLATLDKALQRAAAEENIAVLP